MNLTVALGETEKTNLIIQRNWITGSLFYVENGEMRSLNKPTHSERSFLISRKQTFEFTVGLDEKHNIRLERIRPLVFGGVRPHSYEIFVNDELIKSYKGF
ncbi:hypothetical protein O1D97_03085 [Marinomonas sp. 15G1-11]|uniref:Uncharacterized protein n=1 Tax=Marinomonas phaeophyticola TaxID=3004091 RepID=A0ABT4JQJ2_9GAMM|nr:hypothetical protein [Marinomonas sp. 15G1-11]MCZ2720653.1 hypothetical protein [Marinomonas sp. 15G1-11]